MNFMLLGLPRSGTTWAANWLMDDAICYHDPLARYDLLQLRQMKPAKTWGVSCTFLWAFPEFCRDMDCPIVFIERDIQEINKSLLGMSYPEIPDWMVRESKCLNVPRFNYRDLFDLSSAREIWSILRPDKPHNDERHEILSKLNVTENMDKWSYDPQIMRGLLEKLDVNCQRN